MAAITAKKPCAKCSHGGAVATCDGCQRSFCTKHFVEHRQELSQQMEIIRQDHEYLYRATPIKDISKHPFLNRIDSWERESMIKIQEAAEKARSDFHQLMDRTKNELNSSIEKLKSELEACQKSDDFTENDLKRWGEQMKELRHRFDSPTSISIMYDDDQQHTIRLIKIIEKQQIRSSIPTILRQTSEHRINTSKEMLLEGNEKFADIDGKATLSEGGLIVTGCLASILTQPIIYGLNRYSTGKNQIRFRIEKMGEARLFFGIIRSLENISRSGQGQNNNVSLYGWWDLNEAIINGKLQTTKYRNIVVTGDELLLTIDCDTKQIQLQHQRTKRLGQLTVDLEKCPFPWKLVIRLQSAGDCVRILC